MIEVRKVQIDGPWLAMLAAGWKLAEADACHLAGPHWRYCVLLWREARP